MKLFIYPAFIFILLSCNSALATKSLQQLNSHLQLHKGKVVYVDFWASWCAPCKRSFIWMNEIQKRYPHSLQIITINMDVERSQADEFLRLFPASFPVIYNPSYSIGKAYKLKGMPSSLLYNKKGVMVAQFEGFNEQKKLALSELIKQLILE